MTPTEVKQYQMSMDVHATGSTR